MKQYLGKTLTPRQQEILRPESGVLALRNPLSFGFAQNINRVVRPVEGVALFYSSDNVLDRSGEPTEIQPYGPDWDLQQVINSINYGYEMDTSALEKIPGRMAVYKNKAYEIMPVVDNQLSGTLYPGSDPGVPALWLKRIAKVIGVDKSWFCGSMQTPDGWWCTNFHYLLWMDIKH